MKFRATMILSFLVFVCLVSANCEGGSGSSSGKTDKTSKDATAAAPKPAADKPAPEKPKPPTGLVEAGSWVDETLPGVFVFYYMTEDYSEDKLKELLTPLAEQKSKDYDYVIQTVVHEKAFAEKLASAETKARYDSEPVSMDMRTLEDDSLKVKGGMVHTYVKAGGFHEWIYKPRSEQGQPSPNP